MPLNHGVTVTMQAQSAIASTGATEAIAVVGVAQSGSAVPGTLYLVNSLSEAQQLFGAHAVGDTLPRTFEILARYGCSNVIGLEVAKGVDDTATAAAIVTALDTLKTAKATLGISPKIIIIPGFNQTTVIDKALAVAESLKAISIFQFGAVDTVTTVTTARNGAVGMGLKNPRLVTCFPALKNAVTPTIIEPLATHLAGVIAWQMALKGLGASPDNFPLRDVSGTDIVFSTSWDDETADSEKMFDLGVVSVNSRDGLSVVWGGQNASYPIDTSALSFITGIRIRDTVSDRLFTIAQPWIGSPGSIDMAMTCRAQMQSAVAQCGNGDFACLRLGMVELDIAKSNFDAALGQILWVFKVTLQPISGVALITLTVEVK